LIFENQILNFILMKYLFTIIFAGIFIQLMSQDFRKVNWGESTDLVKSKETAALNTVKSKGDILYYNSTLGDKKVEVVYKFISNKLVRAEYIFEEEYNNKNVYYTDYLNFKTMLTKKYGEPDKYEQKWLNDTYKHDIDRIGSSLSSGNVVIFESWAGEKTNITHAIYGGKNTISHVIEYASVNFAYLEKDVKKKSAIDDL